MSFEDEARAFEQRFSDNFTDLPIKYENARFTPPTNSPWVVFAVLNGAGKQASIGSSPLNRYAGVVQIDIYVPEMTGTRVARAHADTIEAIFHNVQFSAGDSGTIITRTPSITPHGLVDAPDGRTSTAWYRLTVSVAYQRDRVF